MGHVGCRLAQGGQAAGPRELFAEHRHLPMAVGDLGALLPEGRRRRLDAHVDGLVEAFQPLEDVVEPAGNDADFVQTVEPTRGRADRLSPRAASPRACARAVDTRSSRAAWSTSSVTSRTPLNENQKVASASPASVCRHSQYSAPITLAAMAATARLNLTRRGSVGHEEARLRASDPHHSWQLQCRQCRGDDSGTSARSLRKRADFVPSPADRDR